MTNGGSKIALEADPNDPEDSDVTDEAVAHALAERRARRAPGRPKGSTTSAKQQVALRIDRDVLDHFRSAGAGWQTRINAALRRVAGL